MTSKKKRLKRFRVSAEVTISMHTDVDAANEEQARDLALDAGMMSLCHQCAGEDGDGQWVTSGELDGEPTVIEVEEVDHA